MELKQRLPSAPLLTVPNNQDPYIELKQRLTSALLLTVPNNQDPYIVYIDVLGTNLGCVLLQKGKVVAYASC